MKKLILVSLITSCLTGLSAFGQGYFQFVTGKSGQVWDCFTGSPHTATTVNVAFLWAANGSVPEVEMYGASPPDTPPGVWPPMAWTAILTDPNFTLAVNDANGSVAVTRSLSNGVINYNGGTAFGVTGTSVGTTYALYLIGWNAAYATPALAAANLSPVGWSALFNYTAFASTVTPTSFAGLVGQFGVWGSPEPSTLALAGLGGLSLFLLRREHP